MHDDPSTPMRLSVRSMRVKLLFDAMDEASDMQPSGPISFPDNIKTCSPGMDFIACESTITPSFPNAFVCSSNSSKDVIDGKALQTAAIPFGFRLFIDKHRVF